MLLTAGGGDALRTLISISWQIYHVDYSFQRDLIFLSDMEEFAVFGPPILGLLDEELERQRSRRLLARHIRSERQERESDWRIQPC
jgi:hypothetical protein